MKLRVKPKPGLFQTNKPAYADSVLQANKHLEWVQRLFDKNAPSIQIPGQPFRSTHFMSDDGKGYVFPSVVRKPGDAGLTYLGDSAEDYARDNNTGIQLPPTEGSWFAANGYKLAPGVQNSIDSRGVPFNNPKYILNQ